MGKEEKTIINEIKQEFDLPEADINETLSSFYDLNILVDANENPYSLPKRSERYARHMLFFESLGLNGETVQDKISKANIAI